MSGNALNVTATHQLYWSMVNRRSFSSVSVSFTGITQLK